MTNRRAPLPGSSLSEALSQIVESNRAMSQRANWSGSVHSFIGDGTFLDIPVQVIGAGGYPNAGRVSVASLTLDPGRWIIVASIWQESFGFGPGSTALQSEVGATLSALGVERTARNRRGTAGVTQAVRVSLEVVAEASFTVNLYAYAGLDSLANPVNVGRVADQSLIAYPG